MKPQDEKILADAGFRQGTRNVPIRMCWHCQSVIGGSDVWLDYLYSTRVPPLPLCGQCAMEILKSRKERSKE